MTISKLAAFAAVCSFVVFGSALADDERLDEIVVRADFRTVTLAEVPMSVSVLGRDAIAESGVTHFEELSVLIPNLNWAGGSNRARFFQLRGIGERSEYQGAPDPSVGFVIDDIDFSGIGGIANTWDMQAVEVLRGPQATRYGANALAGMVYMSSVAPTEVFDARINVAAGGEGFSTLSLAFGGPLSEQLGYRISAQRARSNGFRDNRFLNTDDSNERDEDFLRARLRWAPSDRTSVDLTALLSDQDNGYDAFTLDNTLTTHSNRPGRDAQHSTALGMRAVHQPNDRYRWVSITGIAQSDIDFSFDADWGNQAFWRPFFAPPADAPFVPDYDFFSEQRRDRETINQELRLESMDNGRLFNDTTRWLVGLYGLRLSESLDTYDDGVFTDGSFAPALEITRRSSQFQSTKLAVFGQIDADLTARMGLSVGLRLERRRADYEDSSPLTLAPRERAVGGHIALSRLFTDAATGYVSLSRGYKMGGFNLGQVPAGRRTFDAEFLWNLEAGFRWQGERVRVSSAVFYSRRRDQQVDTSFQLDPGNPSTFVFFKDNAATGKNIGVEIESSIQLNNQWRVYANLGLLDVSFDEFITPELDLSGREQAHAPSYSAALGAEWRHPRGWFVSAAINGKDAFFFSNSHDQQSEAYELVNLRAGITKGRWELSAWARNMFDERYAVRGFFFGNEPPDFADTQYVRLGDPRQVGISVDWQY